MTKYDKELQTGTDEYEEAMEPKPAEQRDNDKREEKTRDDDQRKDE
jgi:hypothetical protein